MGKGKGKYLIAVIVTVILYVAAFLHSNTRLTYLEYTTGNESYDTFIALGTNEDELRQEFVMPYEIFDSVSVKIGTFGRDNNSTWQFSLLDASGNVLYEDTFNASKLEDTAYYRSKTDRKIKVTKGDTYYFSIKAKDVIALSSLAFYVSTGNNGGKAVLTQNGEAIDNTLCFKVYGGNRDHWWQGLMTFFFLYVLVIIWRFYDNERKAGSIRNDRLLQGMILGALIFALLCSFAAIGTFTDENDNMRGGMVIANGGVLYRDYVTQHTPVVYYLCSVFALLGAGSVEQFRLLYFIFESFVWIFLFIRHRDYYGEKKMMLLPLLETICISTVVGEQGYQILSDGFVGLMFTALMLEFLRYVKDNHLKWGRCIIISICIWGSFGSAFVSAYALFFLALMFLCTEAGYLAMNRIKVKNIIFRYLRLIITLVIPVAGAVVYFMINHALNIAIDQFYAFNREIYPIYKSGLGEKVIQPFVNGVQNFFGIFTENFNSILNVYESDPTILRLVLLGLAVVIIIKLFEKKEYMTGLSLGLMMIFSATRGYGFHGLPAWYLAVLIIALYADLLFGKLKKIGKPLLAILAIILMSHYFISLGDNLLYEQESVSELESKVVDMTEQDDDKDIFLDAAFCDSLYLFYKDRKPVNYAVYMFPWYMDWYEKWDVSALLEKSPHIVIYNEERSIWGYAHYTNIFEQELKSRYVRLGDTGWESGVWVKAEAE